ncbi:MEDS domain-containing protein [Parapedobacter sp. GCM10030251]|uniref:MEDS domain-containing protein n=1 Tax=Parapedobacter sp. GCM10030251 TaxID=3273419 RepID=UPI00360A9D34
MENRGNAKWQMADASVFWGEVAPAEHVVQIYESDESFMNTLEGFVSSGLAAGECVVLIATAAHVSALTGRLSDSGFAVADLTADDQLILLDAEEVLTQFMVNGWPEAKLFNQTVTRIIRRATDRNRPVRAFGEMVALLWAKGEKSATVHLEILWNRFCETQSFCLFCAYPRNGFTQDINSSAYTICCTHSKMISGESRSATKIFYKTAPEQLAGRVV